MIIANVLTRESVHSYKIFMLTGGHLTLTLFSRRGNYIKEVFMISRAINTLFYFYYILIILRIFLSWIPSIDWLSQPFAGIRAVVDPFLGIFRGIIPPIGMLDISPIVAIILLQVLQGVVVGFLNGLGI